jgi:hypothetical protein
MFKLKNGAQVIAHSSSACSSLAEDRQTIVLCNTLGLAGHPFATWYMNKAGQTFWGHYFDTYDEAQADYAERVRRMLLDSLAKEEGKFEPGDQVKDLTLDPPLSGVIIARHGSPDAYRVRLEGGVNDVIIHARNLKKEEVK